MKIIAIAVLLVATSAFALQFNEDTRRGSGKCWTWGVDDDTGPFRGVEAYACLTQVYDNTSNYPVNYSFDADCWYYFKDATAPTCPAGTLQLWGGACAAKTYHLRRCVGGANNGNKCGGYLTCPGGTCTTTANEIETSFPVTQIINIEAYNQGTSSVSWLCTWDPQAYGAPPA